MENKEITMNDLAAMMKEGFEKVDKKMEAGFRESDRRTDEKIEKLAIMIKHSFDGVDKKFEVMAEEFWSVKRRLDMFEGKLDVIERSQEEIKLRQDSAAWHFELDAQEKTLEKHDTRIGALEKKVLLAS
jgi:hypothetical protein